MVALATPRLGYTPTLCLARPMLFAALDCFDRGDVLGAGVRLREAVTRFVKAAAEWYGIELPKRLKYPKPSDYIRALRKADHLDKWGAELLLEMVDTGNKLAHCQSVDVNCIKGGISILFALMDGEPYCGKDRKPVATSHKDSDDDPYSCDDCDDDDGADWWKGGAA